MDKGTPYYEWSFLRKTGTVQLLTDDYDYDLPDDFGGTILDSSVVYNTAGENQPPLAKIDEHILRTHRASGSQKKGYPLYYSVRPKTHNAATGQRWEMLVYPTPNADINSKGIEYRYPHIPEALNTTNKYPVGGGAYSEVILAAHLAEAEAYSDNDGQGIYEQKFQSLLTVALRNDEQQKMNRKEGVA
jgi:hypothetical protein